MSLPENTQYKTYASAIMPTIKGAEKMRSGRAVDTSRYSNLASRVNPQSRSAGHTANEGDRVGPIGTVSVPYSGSTRYENVHPGIDIANKIGTPIRSFTPGTITSVTSGQKQGDRGYGNSVIITDNQGNKQRYSHLQGTYVTVGQPVQRGTYLGPMGNSGSTYSTSGGTGSHLDYRVRDMYNKYINPLRFIY